MPGLDLPPAVEEYRLIRLLGSGAMGSVYLAQDRLLERLVAIKFIAAGAPSASARHRFFAEARAAARITHPNVVAVYRVAEFKRQPFLVAEYVRGRSLAELACPLGSDQLIKIASDLSRGLAAAHRRGVLHRDLKPANAMISEDGVTKLLDFGLAELVSDAGIAEHARLAGTPLYMAPELWTGGDPSPRSDIFALGILLFELYSGAHPFDRRDGNKPADRGPPLDTLVAEPNRALCAIIERCIASDPLLRWSSDALVDALDGVAMIGSAEPRKHEGTPYRGLLAFEAEHRDLFFGRRSEALAIRERLRSERLIVVAGDSGTGKSSLCRAGVLPLLESDTRVVTVVLGRAPMTSLAVALAPIAGESESVTLERLAGDPTGLARSLRATGREIVLFIDQLEELVTLAPPDDARLVAETLQALVLSHGTRVLATARSDFLTRLAAFRGLGDDLAMSLSLLRPLSAERLFEVVVEPAAAMGFVFESGEMVEQLITEARVAEGGLPLLQFALGELWDARDLARKLIPATALTAIGGVAGALARHADGVIAAQPASDRAAARAIFLSLVTTEGTRAHRDHDELIELAARRTPRARAVLDALVSGRLLVAQEAESGGKTAYAIAHEALLSSWGTLRSWLGEDVEGRAAKQRIEHAAAEWERLGRRADALWNARQLSDAAKVDAAALTSREVEF
ncbi:MAG TPA: serine/threonine-protein kinase, partial [Kofleriaceae bacterium]